MGCRENTFLVEQVQKAVYQMGKEIENYIVMLHLASAWITLRATGLFG